MKFFKITVFSFFALAACGSLRAQDLRGVVRDAENQPLVGASVYWAGTTIGASTDAQGAFLLHRVKGYDKLVAAPPPRGRAPPALSAVWLTPTVCSSLAPLPSPLTAYGTTLRSAAARTSSGGRNSSLSAT